MNTEFLHKNRGQTGNPGTNAWHIKKIYNIYWHVSYMIQNAVKS